MNAIRHAASSPWAEAERGLDLQGLQQQPLAGLSEAGGAMRALLADPFSSGSISTTGTIIGIVLISVLGLVVVVGTVAVVRHALITRRKKQKASKSVKLQHTESEAKALARAERLRMKMMRSLKRKNIMDKEYTSTLVLPPPMGEWVLEPKRASSHVQRESITMRLQIADNGIIAGLSEGMLHGRPHPQYIRGCVAGAAKSAYLAWVSIPTSATAEQRAQLDAFVHGESPASMSGASLPLGMSYVHLTRIEARDDMLQPVELTGAMYCEDDKVHLVRLSLVQELPLQASTGLLGDAPQFASSKAPSMGSALPPLDLTGVPDAAAGRSSAGGGMVRQRSASAGDEHEGHLDFNDGGDVAEWSQVMDQSGVPRRARDGKSKDKPAGKKRGLKALWCRHSGEAPGAAHRAKGSPSSKSARLAHSVPQHMDHGGNQYPLGLEEGMHASSMPHGGGGGMHASPYEEPALSMQDGSYAAPYDEGDGGLYDDASGAHGSSRLARASLRGGYPSSGYPSGRGGVMSQSYPGTGSMHMQDDQLSNASSGRRTRRFG